MVRPFLVFTKFDGNFAFDLEHPENSSVDVTLKMDSLWTPVPRLTKNLKSEWYFDVESFPEAHFTATSYKKTGKHTGIMSGPLTLKGITTVVSFDVTLNFKGRHPLADFRDNLDNIYVAAFSAKGEVLRSDYGLTFVKTVGDKIDIQIEASFERKLDNQSSSSE